MGPTLYISLFRRSRLNAIASNITPSAGNNVGSAFELRVVADGGTFESGQKCVAINLQPLLAQ
jgi:hypothetical protein